MSSEPSPLNRGTLRRFVRAIRDLLTSEVRGKAIGLLALLVFFALSVNGLNVVNSYVGRDFMTAISHRDMSGFVQQAIFYVGVFLATTVVAVLYRFAEERLGLLWRSWLTHKITVDYLRHRSYLLLKESGEVGNPDQRIAEDVRAFTTSTLSFTLILANATLAALSFSGVLIAISPLLFAVAVGYAALGTVLTIWLGRPLVWLNYQQSDREADFRAELIHVRENAESIAVLRREGRLTARLSRRIDALVNNFRRITSINRNLSFFTTGYNYLIQVIPTLIIAPAFIRGEIEFGVITQSGMAFAQLLGAFSLIINQFGSISSFAAVVARLGALAEAAEAVHAKVITIQVIEDADRIAFEQLTLQTQSDGPALINGLTVSIGRGTRVLVTGANEAARVALFRVTAAVDVAGAGRIIRPPLDAVLFVPQRPYLAPGTLREVLVRSQLEQLVSDQEINDVLHQVGLVPVIELAGGLNTEVDWANKLSLREQQQLALVRVLLARPAFAILDRLSTTLGPAQVRGLLERLSQHSVSYVVFDDTEAHDLYDAILSLGDNGSWEWQPIRSNGSGPA